MDPVSFLDRISDLITAINAISWMYWQNNGKKTLLTVKAAPYFES